MRLIIALAVAGIIIFLQYYIIKKFWNRNLDVSIDFDKDIVYVNDTNVLNEVIINRKILPLPILQVKFSITRTFRFEKQDNTSVTDNYYRNELYTVMPLQKITRKYPFVCTHRGVFYMNNMDLICRSLFLDKKMYDTRNHTASVCVLPGLISHQDIPTHVKNLIGIIEKNVRLNEDPLSFSGIREYQHFDSIRSVNWKATAKSGSLKVNKYNTTFSKKVVLLLNLDTNSMQNRADVTEWGIRIASHLAKYYITKHIPTALYTNSEHFSVEAGADMSHIRTIEIALARLDTSAGTSSFVELVNKKTAETTDSVEYIIISNYRKSDIVEEYSRLRADGFKIHFIIPEKENVEIEHDFVGDDYTVWMVEDDNKVLSDNY